MGVFDKARSEALDLLGFATDDRSLIQGHQLYNGDTPRIFARLLELDTKQVNGILAVLVAETLAMGTGLVDAAGAKLDVAVTGAWSPDDTFFTLIRDRAVSAAILAEVAPDRPAPSTATTAKEIKSRVRDALKSKTGGGALVSPVDGVSGSRLHRPAADLAAAARRLTSDGAASAERRSRPRQSRNATADLIEASMSREDLSTFLRVIPPDKRTWQTFDDKRLANGQPRRSRRLARVLQVPSPASSRRCAGSTRRTSALASTSAAITPTAPAAPPTTSPAS